MRIWKGAASTLAISLVVAASPAAQNTIHLSVRPDMDIYRAGGYGDGSDGIAPAFFSFPARSGQVLTFPAVNGSWGCGSGAPEFGADGTTSGPCYAGGQNISATGTLSGYQLTDFVGAMAGVFLEDSFPTASPASLRFYFSNSSLEGIQTDFQSLSPTIGQVFFIGDGQTGTGIGATQEFHVPAKATHLYLGYVSNCAGSGVPGCYAKNRGSLSVLFQLLDYQFNWLKQNGSAPAGRCCMGLAYDPASHSSLLFGGYTNPSFLNDTWTWTSRQGWSQLSPANSPTPRLRHAMAYDGAAGNIVLFGGSNSSRKVLGDTWIWDGTTWTEQSPATSPPARTFGAMAYDPGQGTVLLFGGFDSNANPLGDTWAWDGLAKTWTQQFPATSPSPRQAMMAYDDASGTMVLFGGTNVQDCCWNTLNRTPAGSWPATTQNYDDTWIWDGTTWTQQFPASAPPAFQGGSSFAYDADLHALVLFGGFGAPDEAFAWDGKNWRTLHTAAMPIARWVAGMDYDSAAKSLLLFGGFGSTTYDDTWIMKSLPVK